MSYVIKYGEVIATTSETLKPGIYLASDEICKEAIDANREYNLVNAFTVRVSNAKVYKSRRYQMQVA